MYVKLINPKTHGKAAYTNTGSSAQTLQYLQHEAVGEGQEAAFFSADADQLNAAQVRQAIDTNVKGLRAGEAKFYSLVLSPSEQELAHIGGDPEKLRAYTREVMQQYAQNFNLPGGRKLGSQDIVWGAVLHQDRTHRGTDPEVVAGTAKAGEKRTGRQAHVHVIVSARDAEQQITLNPGGRRQRFDLMRWQAASGRHFERQFGYVAQEHEKLRPQATRQRDSTHDAGRLEKIAERVARINLLVPREQRLAPDTVQGIAVAREFDKTFYRMLARVEERARDGRPIDNALQLLSTGREQAAAPQRQATTALHAVQHLIRRARNTQDERTEHVAEKPGRRGAELDIEM
ncbi:DUF5712 family protein [Hymenobacter sp. BT770]|uniref:DUF5712 family protein n=1 Tax=Hymenobacter sp. BT770 TaxID=2886942 RepID=UPI001D11B876|nr:DUF5712 family protein [Hymenobacter sp. BT770]MCC3154732.1 DUF5712 family protein [Hymenobacter sp. BT770]MDO3416553.1 DUF5712 family protein [Hymenobacter sp. BT770]